MRNQKGVFKLRRVAVLIMTFLLILGCVNCCVVFADPPAQIEGEWILSSNGKWWYRHTDGSYTTNDWEYINGYWYHFDSSGWMQSGWLYTNNHWYYLKESGRMVVGWYKVNNIWYYFNSYGEMVTGWLYVNSHWYYLASNGAMCTGWQYINGSWYYFYNSGAMCTDTLYLSWREYNFYPTGQLKSTVIQLYRREQEQSNWCWAACAVMVEQYVTNKVKSQSNVVLCIKGAILNEPASLNQMKSAMEYAADYSISGTGTTVNNFSYNNAVSEIDSNQLFVIRIGWDQGGGHFVIGSGYDHASSSIHVVNPGTGCVNKYYNYYKLIQGTKIPTAKGKWTHTIYY